MKERIKYLFMLFCITLLAFSTEVYADNQFMSYDCTTGKNIDFSTDGWENVSETPGSQVNNTLYEKPDARGVIGDCNMIYVQNTTATSITRAVAALVITFPDEVKKVGSAIMVGKSTALTAAHCVFDASHGGYATKIKVFPARNKNIYPYGTAFVTKYSIPKTYVNSQTAPNDIAVINLDTPIGSKSGYLACKNVSGSELTNYYSIVELSGYPGSGYQTNDYNPETGKNRITSFGEMWGMGGAVTYAEGKYIKHTCDTFPGHSGSGLIYASKYVVGIHNRYRQNDSYNRACKIDAEYLKWINGLIK